MHLLPLHLSHRDGLLPQLTTFRCTTWLKNCGSNRWISHCTRISDEGIIRLVGRCNGIHKLRIPWCRKITDRSINQLATECKHIELLDGSYRQWFDFGACTFAGDRVNPTIKIVKDSHLQKQDAEALAIESASGQEDQKLWMFSQIHANLVTVHGWMNTFGH